MLLKAAACLSLCLFILLICAKAQPSNDQLMRLLDAANTPHTGPFRQAQNAAPFFPSRSTSSVQRRLQMPVASGVINRQQHTICQDTSERFFLATDTIVYYAGDPVPSADGNYFVSGECQKNYAPYEDAGAFLMKFDVNGNILWHKNYDSLNWVSYHWINYQKVLELQDGSILLGGFTSNPVTRQYDVIFSKTTSTGSLVWTKIFNSRLWWANSAGSGSTWILNQMKQDPSSGDVYVAGSFYYGAGASLVRLNMATGNITWSKAYGSASGSFGTPFGLDIQPSQIKLISKFLRSNTTSLCMHRINKTTGDTISIKVLNPVDTTGTRQQLLGYNPLTIRSNGNYLVSGSCFGNFQYMWNGITPFYQASVVELDSSFNFIKAYVFTNRVESNSNNTKISMYADGSGYFTMLRYISGFTANTYSIHFKDGQILRQRKKRYTGYGFPNETVAMQLPSGGTMNVRTMGDSANNVTKLEVLKLHPTDTASYCLGFDDAATSLVTLTYVPGIYGSYDSIRPNVFRESQTQTLIQKDLVAIKQPGCFQVATCDSLKIRTAQPNICQSQTLQITARKNEGCGSAISWTYNTAVVSSAVQANDSTLAIHFNVPWSGYIYGSIQGCAAIVDSVYINVLQSPATLNLGPDTVICPGNTLVLNAHAGYATYQWQDGSVDSILTVSQPGTYSVSVTDACSGAVFKDTVVVLPHPPVLVSAGADRIKCNGDTLHLAAPAGFISYTWWPNYNINTVNGIAVVVNPTVDTSYILKAEKTPGCFAIDTVRVTVYHSPAIRLGADTSLCAGQNLTLSAGAGFASYVWSNGSTAMQATFGAAGTYTVKATTAQGCSSADTLRILNTYARPNVVLDHTAELCTGTSRIFNAGSFSSYRWQDGSANSTFTASGLGTYYVQVQDSHGCTGSDTTKITTLTPLPANFLPADTTICNYATATLQPQKSFAAYRWSNGSTAATATVSAAGTYWLQVKDSKGCAGSDSITLQVKECLKGLFVPTAFTPNSDGKNDLLKPLLFGSVRNYAFTIYNRFGQAIYRTHTVGTGWDGRLNSELQGTGVYTWVCTYTLGSERAKTERGNFVLIR